ncbi:hypothetical protein Lfu02_00820 [Longispora fulva]|uniref:DNA-binding XRE family transcriptional regulator n=1 Tax=Longispora fulva TaxID=619741 RepID=A0A8J7GQ83_9ACTN|nr:helix-turn-helix transcriptional regulator [Longispora fulva]MBG6136048.1 DNA-binding XRE family transcriptional regulator [Longispora fulva]GIG55710.1 hypothetical protein Lfu02_00820 [Longispora fulva]
MADPQDVREARKVLGELLAAYRLAAGHTQFTLAPLTNYVRSTIANVETGRQNVPREFWAICDRLLDAGGALIAGFDGLQDLIRGSHMATTVALVVRQGQKLGVAGPLDTDGAVNRGYRRSHDLPAEQHLAGQRVAHGLDLLEPSPSVMSARRGARPAAGWADAAAITASEATDHAMRVSGGVDPVSIEQVQVGVVTLARGYADLPSPVLLREARRMRDVAYLLLDRTSRPAQTADLYLAAGQACGLAAIASFDMTAWAPAAELAHAAGVYAELVGHAGLRSWARGTAALIQFWTGQPHQAVASIAAGLEGCPSGAAEARLRCIEARAWALLGDGNRTRQALRAADVALAASDGRDDLFDEVGGEFGWGPSRHAACAGSALLQVGDAQSAAARIQAALTLLPADGLGGLVPERAYCDLAAAELAGHRLDATTAALEQVWHVPAARRRHSLVTRIRQVADGLSAARWRGQKDVAELIERIGAFTADAPSQLTDGRP